MVIDRTLETRSINWKELKSRDQVLYSHYQTSTCEREPICMVERDPYVSPQGHLQLGLGVISVYNTSKDLIIKVIPKPFYIYSYYKT